MTLNKIRMLIVITAKKDFPSEQNSLIAMTMLPTGTNRRKKYYFPGTGLSFLFSATIDSAYTERIIRMFDNTNPIISLCWLSPMSKLLIREKTKTSINDQPA